MAKPNSVMQRIPINFFEKAKTIKEKGNLKNRIDAFKFVNSIQPIILSEKSIRLPKSKSILRQIDVRYYFEDKR